MKVLHAAETIKGGVATVLKQLMIAQIGNYNFTSVVSIVPDDQQQELLEVPMRNIVFFKRTGRNILSFLAFLKVFIKAVVSIDPDIVHLHSTFAGFLGRIGLFLIWPIRRPKVIYCPHAFSFMMESSKLKLKFFLYAEKMLLGITDKIICVSNYEKEVAVVSGLASNKMLVIHNGVKARRYICKKRSGDNINLLFVGRLDYQKGYDLLIKAMQDIRDPHIHLTIVGDSVNEEIEKTELENITYTGWLNPTALENYFIKADVLIIPSRWEGFAMVPLEAMSYSLAIIASNSTSLPEVVKDGVTGFLFENNNYESLLEKITLMTESNIKKMGQAGNEFFIKNFTADVMIAKTIEVYMDIKR